MGIVYAGRDVRLDRLVAIKVLPELVSSDVVRERFLREARAAARLSHPSIVPIYSADDRNGVTFMVMAFVDGTTLSTRLRDGNCLSPADAVPILRDVEAKGPTGGAMLPQESALGPLLLQEHGHAVRYRDVWFVPDAR